jgi:hypothetical protein
VINKLVLVNLLNGGTTAAGTQYPSDKARWGNEEYDPDIIALSTQIGVAIDLKKKDI